MKEDGLIGKLTHQEWLNSVEERLQNGVHKVFAMAVGRQAKNFLHGTWIGHPRSRDTYRHPDRRLDNRHRL